MIPIRFTTIFCPVSVDPRPRSPLAQALAANLVSSITPNFLNSFNFGCNQIYADFTCNGTNELDSVARLTDSEGGAITSWIRLPVSAASRRRQFRKTGELAPTATATTSVGSMARIP